MDLKRYWKKSLITYKYEVEAVNNKTEAVTPNFSEKEIGSISEAAFQSELESVAATESVAVSESIESLKSITPPSLEEVRKKLLVKSDSQ